MVDKNSTDSQGGVELPDNLIQDLRAVIRTQVPILSEFDKAVLDEARHHLRSVEVDSRPARWAAGRWLPAAAAVAATVLITIGLRSRSEPRHASPESGNSLAVAREDLDSSGRVDILDALMLARLVKQGGPVSTEWDMNQDGHVDQDDVQLIAQSAVRLDPKG